MRFEMVARNWQIDGSDRSLASPAANLFKALGDISYCAEIRNVETNSAQITHGEMDLRLGERIEKLDGRPIKPSNRETKDCDLFFSYQNVKVIVEVERANHEKFLRDLLKIHRYLHHGANLGVLVVPRTFAHSGGSTEHLKTARSHIEECQRYGFWNENLTDRFLLVGFDLFEAASGRPYSPDLRKEFQERARGQ